MRLYHNILLVGIFGIAMAGCASSQVNKRTTTHSLKTPRSTSWCGIASWYGRDFDGRCTANGEIFDMYEYTAAHRTLPFGTRVRVTNLRDGRHAVVRINDRGPFVAGREIDLSYVAARDIGILRKGLETVRLDILPN